MVMQLEGIPKPTHKSRVGFELNVDWERMMEADESEVQKPIYMGDIKLAKVLGIYQDFVASTTPETIVCRKRQAIANVLNTELIVEVLNKYTENLLYIYLVS